VQQSAEPMSEPNAIAASVDEVVPGIWHWALEDDRIGGFISSAHAILGDDGSTVLVDPLPLESSLLTGLAPVAAICLTAGTHERSAWRYRRELGVPVYAPAAVRLVAEEPDVRYSEGDQLPAGLQPYFAPGPGTTQHALLLPRSPGILFTSDLFVNQPGERLGFVPDEYVHDPEESRKTARRLLDLDFDVLCVGHGAPILEGAKDAIRALLAQDA
jgi:glyoxylase-like metal-dependent hydrolase (beta-lactamase superfamily II)